MRRASTQPGRGSSCTRVPGPEPGRAADPRFGAHLAGRARARRCRHRRTPALGSGGRAHRVTAPRTHGPQVLRRCPGRCSPGGSVGDTGRGGLRPRGLRTFWHHGLGRGLDPAHLRELSRAVWAVGRGVLPLLGGDRIPPARTRCRVLGALRPRRGRHPSRRRLGDLTAPVGPRSSPTACASTAPGTAGPQQRSSGACCSCGRDLGQRWAASRRRPPSGCCAPRASCGHGADRSGWSGWDDLNEGA